jgi:hypothetical protein
MSNTVSKSGVKVTTIRHKINYWSDDLCVVMSLGSLQELQYLG